ncbi:MAG: acyl carrier protein [Hungatella sp.]|nr:acyl carrier protein [Hungatella sp.]
MGERDHMKREEIVDYMTAEIAENLKESAENIDPDANFMKLGISSVQALKIINKLRKKMNVDITPVAMFEYKTITEFADYLTGV